MAVVAGDQADSAQAHHGRLFKEEKLKILLLDNDFETLQCVAHLLKDCSYAVTPVADVTEALRTLAAEPQFDLVLADIHTTEQDDGMQLLSQMNRKPKAPPFVAMSAEQSHTLVLTALDRGAADFLIKPMRRNELSTLWRHVWKIGGGPTSTGDVKCEMDGSSGASTGFAQSTSQQQQSSAWAAPLYGASASLASQRPHEQLPMASNAQIAPDCPKQGVDVAGGHNLFQPAQSDSDTAQPTGRFHSDAISPATSNFDSVELKIQPLELSLGLPACPASPHHTGMVWQTAHSQLLAAARNTHASLPQGLQELAQLGHQLHQQSQQPFSNYAPAGSLADLHMMAAAAESLARQDAHGAESGSPEPQSSDDIQAWPKECTAGVVTSASNAAACLNQASSRATCALNRKAAILKFREKRKARNFDKKVRYVSRKRLAEARPRIRGQFVKADVAAAYHAQHKVEMSTPAPAPGLGTAH